MESFGATLRQAREARGIDLERASLETNITASYLDALEKELISSFPCDTYLIGFLKNYAEYLNLDSEELVTMYKAVKTQIEPAPLELLLEPKKKIPIYAVVGAIIGLAIVSVAAYLIVRLNIQKDEKRENIIAATPQSSVYQLGNVPMTIHVFQDDKIEIPFGDEVIELKIADTSGILTIDTPFGSHVVELSEEIEIDLDGQPGNEISIYLDEISKTDASRGADIEIMRIKPEAELAAAVVAPPAASEQEETVSKELASEVTEAGIKRKVILDSVTAYPVMLNVDFKSQCLFRYQIDRKDIVEDFYTNGQNVRINANNGFRLWISNSKALEMQIIGGGHTEKLDNGRAGQVLVEDIKWIKDDDGRFKLVVMEVE